MAAMDVSELRKNAKIDIDGQPYVVVDFQFVKPGKGQGLYKCKIKNMITGSVLDRTWRSGERFEPANVESKRMQYLFANAGTFTFMDNETFEQIEIPGDTIGDPAKYMKESEIADVLFYDDNQILGVDVQMFATLKVTEASTALRGDTATNVNKLVTLETGAIVQVPAFVTEGDTIRVDTRTGDYIERVK